MRNKIRNKHTEKLSTRKCWQRQNTLTLAFVFGRTINYFLDFIFIFVFCESHFSENQNAMLKKEHWICGSVPTSSAQLGEKNAKKKLNSNSFVPVSPFSPKRRQKLHRGKENSSNVPKLCALGIREHFLNKSDKQIYYLYSFADQNHKSEESNIREECCHCFAEWNRPQVHVRGREGPKGD